MPYAAVVQHMKRWLKCYYKCIKYINIFLNMVEFLLCIFMLYAKSQKYKFHASNKAI